MPQDHLLRAIDRFVELADVRRHLEPFYSAIGRPSIDPDLMIRMLLVGYCCGIRSERRLCQEVHLNLAYRWFCRLDLNDAVPNHSTFSKNRHGRFRDCDLFRQLFETVLARCIAEGLVGGEAFGIDASLIKADANREDGSSRRTGLLKTMLAAPRASISTRSTMLLSVLPRRCNRSICHPSIRRPAGPPPIVARRTSYILPIISSISTTP